MRVIGLTFGIALLVAAWYVGMEWWKTPVHLKYTTRAAARLEIMGVVVAVTLITYIAYVWDRDCKSR